MKSENSPHQEIPMLAQTLATKRELTQSEIEQVAGGMRSIDTWCPSSGCCYCLDKGFID